MRFAYFAFLYARSEIKQNKTFSSVCVYIYISFTFSMPSPFISLPVYRCVRIYTKEKETFFCYFLFFLMEFLRINFLLYYYNGPL